MKVTDLVPHPDHKGPPYLGPLEAAARSAIQNPQERTARRQAVARSGRSAFDAPAPAVAPAEQPSIAPTAPTAPTVSIVPASDRISRRTLSHTTSAPGALLRSLLRTKRRAAAPSAAAAAPPVVAPATVQLSAGDLRPPAPRSAPAPAAASAPASLPGAGVGVGAGPPAARRAELDSGADDRRAFLLRRSPRFAPRDPADAVAGAGSDKGVGQPVAALAAALPGLPLFGALGAIRIDVLLMWVVLVGTLLFAVIYMLWQGFPGRFVRDLLYRRRVNRQIRGIKQFDFAAAAAGHPHPRTRAGRPTHPDYRALLRGRSGRPNPPQPIIKSR